ncbi:hypothetical protein NPIL_493701 [Nephila pilipes]|uniref:Uncharacterized protein n=1 Tax=Nephila pilipes TaxID=299642 RepID=A0A8X6QAL1_NEPPI|nr:hypothetical protein NPIL_493701 [Nephila pilipes]
MNKILFTYNLSYRNGPKPRTPPYTFFFAEEDPSPEPTSDKSDLNVSDPSTSNVIFQNCMLLEVPKSSYSIPRQKRLMNKYRLLQKWLMNSQCIPRQKWLM